MRIELEKANLRRALTDAARAAFTEVRSAHPDEHFYAFAFMVSFTGLCPWIGPACNSHEALAVKLAANPHPTGVTPEALAPQLRWSAPDWTYFLAGDQHFEGVRVLLEQELDEGGDSRTFGWRQQDVFEACRGALQDLDAMHFFGEGEARNEVTLAILLGDQSNEHIHEHVRLLNPPAARARIEADLPTRTTQGRYSTLGSRNVYSIDDLALSRDGGTLAAAGAFGGGEIFAWDLAGRRELLVSPNKREAYWRCALSPDGTLLLAGNRSGQIHRWALPSGEVLRPWGEHVSKPVKALAWSPDGRRVASSSWDSKLILWDAATGEIVQKADLAASSLIFVNDGEVLLAADGQSIRFLELDTLAQRTTVPSQCTVCAVSADSRQLAAAAEFRAAPVLVWGVAHPTSPLNLVGPTKGVTSLAFSPDGRRLAAADSAGEVHVWNVATGRRVDHFRGLQESMNAVVFLPDGVSLASAGRDVNHGAPVYLWATTPI